MSFSAAAVGPLAVLQDLGPDQVLLEALEQLADRLGIGALLGELGRRPPCAGRGSRLRGRLVLVGAVDGRLELLAEALDELLLERFVDGRRRRLLLGLAGQLAQLFLGVDDRLHRAMAGHDRFEDQVFGQLVRAGLDHQHRVCGAGDGQVEQRLVVQLAHGRVDDQLAVDVAHLDRGDRALERDARQGQRGAGADDAQDGRIVLLVGRHDQVHDLDVVAVVLGEERPDRPIGQAGGQDGLLAGAALALDEAAGDLARGVHALFVFDGEREKVDALAGFGGRHGGGEQDGIAIA